MPLILQDSGSVFWLVGVTDDGLLTTTVVGSGPATPTIFIDSGDSSLWQLGVTTSGNLTTTSVGSGEVVSFVTLVSPSTIKWNLMLLPSGGGLLQTVFVPPYVPGCQWGDVDVWFGTNQY